MSDLTSALVQASKGYADPIAAAYASGNRPYTVQLKRPGPAGHFDRASNAFVPREDEVFYDGPARIYLSSSSIELQQGDENRPFNAATISIDYFTAANSAHPTWTPRKDDIVVVTSDAQATEGHLPNRIFEVTGVEVGGHFGIGWVLQTLGAMPSGDNPGS